MKNYRCKKDLAVRYAFFGLVLLAAMAYLFMTEDISAFTANRYSMAFLVGGTVLSLLYVTRGINARLQLRENEIFFWDGLADIRHIRYENIALIEYHPALRIRFQMRDRKKTVFSIPNIFTTEDANEILKEVGKKKYIRIERVSGPRNRKSQNDIKSEEK